MSRLGYFGCPFVYLQKKTKAFIEAEIDTVLHFGNLDFILF